MVESGWVGGWVLVGGGLGCGSILEHYHKYTMLYFNWILYKGKQGLP